MNPPALSIMVSPPIWAIFPPIISYTLKYPLGYQHTIQAIGGYDTAQFNIGANWLEVEDWLETGLGRDIKVYNDAQRIVWEGFVNEVSANLGALSETRGPLLDIGNRVYVVYSPMDTSTTGTPINGGRVYTSETNDTDSQAKWGIQYKILSAGSVTKTEAEYLRDTWLEENAWPQTSQRFGGGGGIGATISCRGYWHMLNFPYLQFTIPGDVDISNPTSPTNGKIQRILAAEPNSIFPADYGLMSANTMEVPGWESDDTSGQALIQAMTAAGDTAHNRWVVGIYAGRKCKYNQVPSDAEYFQYLSDPAQQVITPQGNEVKPWDVLPGKWLFYPDHMIGRAVPSDKRLDPRYEFIESVTYNSEANPSLSHTGGKVWTLPQIIGRWGILEE